MINKYEARFFRNTKFITSKALKTKIPLKAYSEQFKILKNSFKEKSKF